MLRYTNPKKKQIKSEQIKHTIRLEFRQALDKFQIRGFQTFTHVFINITCFISVSPMLFFRIQYWQKHRKQIDAQSQQ